MNVIEEITQQLGEDLRSNDRRPWRSELDVTLLERHGASTQTRVVTVTTCDVSSGGIGFLHGSFIHVGTSVELVFKELDSKPVVKGTIVHCEYDDRSSQHRIGVSFSKRE